MKTPDDPRYPLLWPFGWKRTLAADRGRFGAREAAQVTKSEWRANGGPSGTGGYVSEVRKGTKPVTMRTACQRLSDQLERLGAEGVVLSTNVELTLSGEPRGDRRDPEDPGAAVYFKLTGKDRVLACDCWLTVPQNIAAIANHVDAIRRIERYGVGTLDQAFTGYDALPPPHEGNRPPWRAVMQFRPNDMVTVEIMQARYRSLAKMHGSSETALLNLNLAREAALQELKSPSQSFVGAGQRRM